MNRISYYITTHLITSNKNYNFYRNPHSVYQTYPNCLVDQDLLHLPLSCHENTSLS